MEQMMKDKESSIIETDLHLYRFCVHVFKVIVCGFGGF
ncbi:hypothetical protein AQPE_2749 [Aquipluma nitroreducens]|uniref:Uncharacterized protein n=1 Tax=Aquipluma nitroreducens TaxID=2010828 RepID=A0A5K7SAU7_9BACT|nr:hypothetical protein AQPE_2749 [Aquipluma nitroreducens]